MYFVKSAGTKKESSTVPSDSMTNSQMHAPYILLLLSLVLYDFESQFVTHIITIFLLQPLPGVPPGGGLPGAHRPLLEHGDDHSNYPIIWCKSCGFPTVYNIPFQNEGSSLDRSIPNSKDIFHSASYFLIIITPIIGGCH